MIHTIRLLLGDQLNHQHSWFAAPDDGTLYVLMETRSETDYTRHHLQKIVGFFLAMRAFAGWLRANGHQVRYFQLDDPDNRQTIEGNLEALFAQHPNARVFGYQAPDEYRLDQALERLCADLHTRGIACQLADTEHFLSARSAVAELFAGKKTYLMERFYREMRLRYNLLLEADGKNPLFGRWNLDSENRRKLPPEVPIPPAPRFVRSVRNLVEMIQTQGVAYIGEVDADRFAWAVTREEALQCLEDFARKRLPLFGTYQDAMSERDGLLFHSQLSFALNIKLLHPLEVVQTCIEHWRQAPQRIAYAQIEGFVRQIIGWREFMRGVYWAQMPDFARQNFFDHQRPLPSWFWDGLPQMRCLRQAIGQSRRDAYAHHIQRLMLTGNFALLLGAQPDEVDAWYLGIYMDAVEWVQLPNTRGMSQYADGGLVATKPYTSSANYIAKMGDHCARCPYNPKARHGKGACPFNSLYWDFHHRHRALLEKNPRIGMVYQLWDKLEDDERRRTLEQAAFYKENADTL